MDITQTSSITTATANSGRAATGTSDYQTFLTMLTTQLKNQDPTAPMESTDFAVQLATFSGVEQQTATNELLTAIGAKIDAMTLSDLSSYLGSQALVTTPVTTTGEDVTLYPQVAADAETTWLAVTDATGSTVARQAFDPKATELTWSPVTSEGTPLPDGTYGLTVQNYAGDVLTATTPVGHYETVAEARNESSGVVLVLDSGARVAASDVASLRR